MDSVIDAQDAGMELVPFADSIGDRFRVLEPHLASVGAFEKVAVDLVAQLAR